MKHSNGISNISYKTTNNDLSIGSDIDISIYSIETNILNTLSPCATSHEKDQTSISGSINDQKRDEDFRKALPSIDDIISLLGAGWWTYLIFIAATVSECLSILLSINYAQYMAFRYFETIYNCI